MGGYVALEVMRQAPERVSGLALLNTNARPDSPESTANRHRLMALAESLGGVETLISHPASMTHASVPAERRQAMGLTDSLVRISVGIEDADDLIADLTQALD